MGSTDGPDLFAGTDRIRGSRMRYDAAMGRVFATGTLLMTVGMMAGCSPAPPRYPPNVVAPVIGLPPITIDETRPGLDVQPIPTAEEIAAREQTIRVPASVARTMLERRPVSIGYPAAARAQRLSGHVAFRLIVAKNGTVEGLTVTESSNMLFTPLATAAVQTWQYRPYMLNGKPIAMDTTARVEFSPPQDQPKAVAPQLQSR